MTRIVWDLKSIIKIQVFRNQSGEQSIIPVPYVGQLQDVALIEGQSRGVDVNSDGILDLERRQRNFEGTLNVIPPHYKVVISVTAISRQPAFIFII